MKLRLIIFLLSLLGLYLYLHTQISLSFFALLILTLVSGILYKVESKIYFMTALIVLIINPILIFTKELVLVEKVARVIYLYILLGLGQELIQYIKPSFSNSNINQFVFNIFHDLFILARSVFHIFHYLLILARFFLTILHYIYASVIKKIFKLTIIILRFIYNLVVGNLLRLGKTLLIFMIGAKSMLRFTTYLSNKLVLIFMIGAKSMLRFTTYLSKGMVTILKYFKNSYVIRNWQYALLVLFVFLYLIYIFIRQSWFFNSYFLFDPIVAYFQDLLIYQIIVLIMLFIGIGVLSKKYHISNLIVLICVTFYLIFLQVSFNSISNYIKDTPYITKVTPTEGSMWSHVTVYGNNFGNAQYNNAQLFLEQEPQRVLIWTDKKIVFVVDALRSHTGAIKLRNVDQKVSNKVHFKYIPL